MRETLNANTNPLAALLLADMLEALRGSDTLTYVAADRRRDAVAPSGAERQGDNRVRGRRVCRAEAAGRGRHAQLGRSPTHRRREPLSRPARVLCRQGQALSRADLGPDLLREHDGHLLHAAAI